MSRMSVGFDRTVTFLTGLGLLALGLAAVAWHKGVIGANRAVQTPLRDWTAASWWPWAVGGAGIVLILLALRWLAAHRWAARASRVSLPGDAGSTADATSVASAAADALGADAAVTKASGAATLLRGRPTITLTARVPARYGLPAAVGAADEAARTAAVMLGDSVALRTILHIDTKAGAVVR